MKLRNRTKSIDQQIAQIKVNYSNFSTTIHRNKLIVSGELRPTARSSNYKFMLEYTIHKVPKVRIVTPKLVINELSEPIPHMYGQKHLCLFQPKYSEFKASDFLANTVIPWISLWLYFYEQWHITGKWLGGGEHPKVKINKSKLISNKVNHD